jgi:hypothetical protein
MNVHVSEEYHKIKLDKKITIPRSGCMCKTQPSQEQSIVLNYPVRSGGSSGAQPAVLNRLLDGHRPTKASDKRNM